MRLINTIKLYIIIISINFTARILISVLIALLIRIICIKYQIVHAAEVEFYTAYAEEYDKELIIMKNKSGQEVSFLLTGNYDFNNGVQAYRLTKSEQAHPGLETYLTLEQYKASKQKRDNEILFLLAKKYKKIPYADYAEPCTPCPLITFKPKTGIPVSGELSIPAKIEKFDYNQLFAEFRTLLSTCSTSTEKQRIVFIMKFLQENIPHQFLSLTPQDITNPNSNINTFVEHMRNRVKLYNQNDVLTWINFHAGIATYNAANLEKELGNFQLIVEIYTRTKNKLLGY